MRGFAFLLNLLDYSGTLPFEILPSVFFDRANAEESQKIRHFLSEISHFVHANMYFVEPRKVVPKGAWDYEKLPTDKIRFWVLRSETKSETLWDLSTALLLTDAEPEIGMACPNPTTVQINNPTIYHFFEHHHLPIETDIDQNQLSAAGRYYSLWHEFKKVPSDPARSTVVRALGDLKYMLSTTRAGRLTVLGYFSIIESLITHDPTPAAGDSLNHQIKSKAILLSRRFEKPLDHCAYFGSKDLKKIWAALYEYRSRIAHGESIDLEHKELRILRDHDSVRLFIKAAMKQFLILGLREPDLLHDLKAC